MASRCTVGQFGPRFATRVTRVARVSGTVTTGKAPPKHTSEDRAMANGEGRAARSILDGTFFEPVEDGSNASVLKAECKLCGKVISGSRTSTSNFKVHLKVRNVYFYPRWYSCVSIDVIRSIEHGYVLFIHRGYIQTVHQNTSNTSRGPGSAVLDARMQMNASAPTS